MGDLEPTADEPGERDREGGWGTVGRPSRIHRVASFGSPPVIVPAHKGANRERARRVGGRKGPSGLTTGRREAKAALAWLEPRCNHLLVHFDMDVIDFTDQPLSENTVRNQGLPFTHTMRALRVLLGGRRLSARTITELNPNHGAEDGSTVALFVATLASAVAASPLLSEESYAAGTHRNGKR